MVRCPCCPRRGILAGSGPSIAIEYISTYNPQETVVRVTLAQTIGEHFDGEESVGMLNRLVEAARYGKSKLNRTPLVVAPLSMSPGESNLRASLPHEFSVGAVAFSHDGKTIASDGDSDVFNLWDVETGAHLMTLNTPGHNGARVAFSPDGKTIATDGGSQPGDILLWNIATAKTIATLRDGEMTWALAFSPDGALLASGDRDHAVKLWDVATGKVKFNLDGHAGGVASVAFSRDGKMLATASADKTVKLWNVSTGKDIITIKNTNPVASVTFSADGHGLAEAVNGTIEIRDVTSGEKTDSIAADGFEIRCVTYNRDGTILASGGWDHKIKLWDATSHKLIAALNDNNTVPAIAFSPDGKTLASASWDKTVKLWNVGIEKKTEK